jgi:hypothetical protein
MWARRYLRALEDSRSDKVVAGALTLAAIVAYCRPFKVSFDAARKRRTWIPQWVDDLSPRSRCTHERLVTARDQAWAHTDWGAHTPRADPSSLLVVSRDPWVPMDREQVVEFDRLLDEIDTRLEVERQS